VTAFAASRQHVCAGGVSSTPLRKGRRSSHSFWQTSAKVSTYSSAIGPLSKLTHTGITECQIISWMVKPGDHVEQFDPLCEVQSDKASVEVNFTLENIFKYADTNIPQRSHLGTKVLSRHSTIIPMIWRLLGRYICPSAGDRVIFLIAGSHS